MIFFFLKIAVKKNWEESKKKMEGGDFFLSLFFSLFFNLIHMFIDKNNISREKNEIVHVG